MGSPWPRDWTCISCCSCIIRRILYHWTTWEAHILWVGCLQSTFPKLSYWTGSFSLRIFLFLIFLLWWKSHNIKHTILTILNCTVQWHWVHSHCATLTIIYPPKFSPSKTETLTPLNAISPFPIMTLRSLVFTNVFLTLWIWFFYVPHISGVKQYLSAPNVYQNAFLRLTYYMLYKLYLPSCYTVGSH